MRKLPQLTATKGSYIVLSCAIMYVVIQPIVDIFYPLAEMQLGALWAISLVLAISFIIHFDIKLNELKIHFDIKLNELKGLNTAFKNVPLRDAIVHGAKKSDNNIKNMDVYAFTTAVIQPIIRNEKFHIQNCRVMLYDFEENDSIQRANQLQDSKSLIIDMWEKLKTDGRIQNLEIIKYSERPTDYLIVIDEHTMISGYYLYDDKSPHGNLFKHPLMITSENVEAVVILNKSRERFNDLWNYWKKNDR